MQLQAIASSVDTPTQGVPEVYAMPLTAATPIRMPVKEPGPDDTA